MRKFAYAIVFATAISAPALTGALMDHSAVSVQGAPCTKASCSVGGAGQGGTSSDGAAKGGQSNITVDSANLTNTGTLATSPGNASGTGRQTLTSDTLNGTGSGNFSNGIPGTGHCTGDYQTQGACSTGP